MQVDLFQDQPGLQRALISKNKTPTRASETAQQFKELLMFKFDKRQSGPT